MDLTAKNIIIMEPTVPTATAAAAENLDRVADPATSFIGIVDGETISKNTTT